MWKPEEKGCTRPQAKGTSLPKADTLTTAKRISTMQPHIEVQYKTLGENRTYLFKHNKSRLQGTNKIHVSHSCLL